MPGIFVMAIITTVVACFIGGYALRSLSRPQDRFLLLVLFLIELPMCVLAFYFLRDPMLKWLGGTLGIHSWLFMAVVTLGAPLTEEPAKFWPALVLRGRIEKANYVVCAMALGLGFGVGELWFIAALQADLPALAQAPWYAFSGFFTERLMVCVLHAGFTTVALGGLRRPADDDRGPRRPILAILGAVSLHWALNFPIFLKGLGLGIPAAIWDILLGVWTVCYFIGMLTLLYGRYDGTWE